MSQTRSRKQPPDHRQLRLGLEQARAMGHLHLFPMSS
eukprot:CAMPEP_0194503554 /NCGR_PEP_ID=MMETSP0253-20130528/28446_1 /TAXON_ID=2966 /ORGANISM="Noctiluca scintillans" /LENGTH=36 /DNA_ID= /DNA_START= /DNA_END= /DNA_ORIENTATION=